MRNTGLWVAIKCMDHLWIQITSAWITNSKDKGKVHPGTCHEGPRGCRGIVLLLLLP